MMSTFMLTDNLFPESSFNRRLAWGVGALAIHALLIVVLFGLSHTSPQMPNLMSVALFSSSAPAPLPAASVPQHPQQSKPKLVSNSPQPAPNQHAPQSASSAAQATNTSPSTETSTATDTGKPGANSAFVAPRFDAAYLNNPAPAYPVMSKRLGEQGKVMLRVHVLPTGTADRVDIQKSSGSARLDLAAQEAVQRWRFVPAKQAGNAIAEWVIVPVSFNLKEK